MVNFREITYEEAMEMIRDKKTKQLYLMTGNGLDCVESYRLSMGTLCEREWFKKETNN